MRSQGRRRHGRTEELELEDELLELETLELELEELVTAATLRVGGSGSVPTPVRASDHPEPASEIR